MSTPLKPRVFAVEWKNDACLLLDQRRLPRVEDYLSCSQYEQVVEGIKTLAVRGAPAIGVAGAFAVVLAARQAATLPTHEEKKQHFLRALKEIAEARPTAVNLEWAVSKMKQHWERELDAELTDPTLKSLLELAQQIHREDIDANRRMAENGAALFEPESRILTHCNTGDLATGGIGTAFGVIHQVQANGNLDHVYACEARPVLQGIRLTAWELRKNEIPFTVICDSMAAAVVREKKISGIILGADRIAANGDVANKIGTYGLAILANYHQIPFYVAAPVSTFDLSLASGDEIPIEERAAEEVRQVLGENRPTEPFPVFNPAFDVTPHELITAIVCDRGVIRRPTKESVRDLLS